MKNMNLKAIAAACNGTYYGDDREALKEVSSVVIDSRKIEKDSLFIAIKGARVDGHDYINQVYEAGALCCISEKELPTCDKPYIKVESSLVAIKQIAAYYRSQLAIKVIGITGSVGKTSTKETIAAVMATKYNTLKTQGNFNNEIGVPLTVFRLTEENEVAVLEMGISDFGEMSRLTAIAKPDVCVITNIGNCHLENLGTRDGVLKAKTEIFQGLAADGKAVLNGDDDKLITVSDVNGSKPVFFGRDNTANCEVWAENVVNKGLLGSECDICFTDGVRVSVTIPIPGIHMVNNALAAAAVARQFGIEPADIAKGIAGLETLAGRNHIIQTEKYTVIDDCYNANPASMKASVDVLDMADTRKVAILGDMFELGENEVTLHREVGEYIAKKNINLLITIGKLSKNISDAVATLSSIKTIHFVDKDDFFANADKILEKKDTILVKASHGMEFSRIVERL